jgi:8-oxo-dGTP pyrophosphatase MutT (NUDIX family)
LIALARFQVTPAVFLMLIENNKVLMLLRKGTGYMDGYYSLVAGHMDGDETVKGAMVREALEEANIVVDENEIDVALVMHRFSSDERVDFFITVNNYSGTITNMEPCKCEKLEWFDLEELPVNVVPNVRHAIDMVRNKVTFTEFDDRELNLD